MNPRKLILFWTLLVLLSLGLGGASIWLLIEESRRIENISSRLLEEKAAAIRENLILLVEETQIGLMDSLQSFPESEINPGLEGWAEQNPFVRATFTWDAATASLVYFGPDRATANELERALIGGVTDFLEGRGSGVGATLRSARDSAFSASEVSGIPPEQGTVGDGLARDTEPGKAEAGNEREMKVAASAPAPKAEEVLGASNAAEARQRVRDVTKEAYFEQRAREDARRRSPGPQFSGVAEADAVDVAESGAAESVEDRVGRSGEADVALSDEDRADSVSRNQPHPSVGKPIARLAPFELEAAPPLDEAEPLPADIEEIDPQEFPAIGPVEGRWTWFRRGGDAQLVGIGSRPGSSLYRGVLVDREELLAVLRSALPGVRQDTGAVQIRPVAGRSSRTLELIPGLDGASLVVLDGFFPGYQLVVSRASGDVFDSGFWILAGFLLFILVLSFFLGGSVLLWMARQTALAAQQKTDFLSNVSHELKTPLTTIRMYAEMLEEERVKDPARKEKYLRTIGAETQRLARLVNNILEFSALQKGRSRIQTRDTDLVALVREFSEVQAPRVSEAGINLVASLPNRPLPVRVDPDAIEQVLLNLLDNALKYAPDSETLSCSLETEEGHAVIRFCDQGPGIPGDQQKQVFEAFHRVDNSLTQSRPGSGLGLSIARSLLRQMSGELRYKPNPGGGSCFLLEIPLHPVDPKKP